MKRLFLTLLLSMFFSTAAFAQDNATLEVDEDKMTMKEDADKKMEEQAAPDFVVRMKNNKFLRGVPVDMAFIDVYILGTKVAVPLDQISGVRFAQGDDEKGTVALKNGEMLSGRIDPPKIVLAVDWGQATINSAYVNSMVRDGNMQWSMRNGPNGPQWFLAPRTVRSSAIFDRPSQFAASPVSSMQPIAAHHSGFSTATRTATQPTFNVKASYAAPISDTTSVTAFPSVNPSEFNWIW